MAKEEQNVVFTKNDLGNIDLKHLNGEELEGYIRHTEYFLTDFYAFTLRVDEEEFKDLKRVFIYLRTKKKLKKHLAELTTYAKNFFKDAEVVSGGEKTKDKFYVIDLFLYE